ncbi:hypothetical protein CH305_17040 [Rhodococcus sp. 15-649-2-2]|uniref:restriction endonuclease n=1 Tax=Rhodococcus sp. 15-649-2-2 TaxID=2023140 RepID=UPI000B9A78CC|nr:hypothetical protein CH305_17040 [Rhodococcus sp. 15-649-2-2]
MASACNSGQAVHDCESLTGRKNDGPGADGGIDVDSSTAVAQVKQTRAQVGRPDVQRLYGVACSLNNVALFFSANGYSLDARAWADRYGVELHESDHRLAKFR